MPSAERSAVASRARRAVDLALVGLTLAVSAFVLFWPTTPGPPLFPYADKIIHALVFLALAWTAARAGGSTGVLALSLGIYAVGSEVVQHTALPGRSGDWSDAVVDVVGAVLGLWLAGRLSTRR